MDSFKPFREFEIEPFKFNASRYEIYQNGDMVESGRTVTSINVNKDCSDNLIKVHVSTDSLFNKIDSCFEFDKCITLHDRMLMLSSPRETNADIIVVATMKMIIGTTRDCKYYDRNEPVVGSIYTDDGFIVKMSFTLANPERLIELYL